MKTNTELQKINLIRLIISLQDYEVLNEIENFISIKISNKPEDSYKTTGKYLTKEKFQEHIYSIQDEVKNGKFINHSEILKEIEDE